DAHVCELLGDLATPFQALDRCQDLGAEEDGRRETGGQECEAARRQTDSRRRARVDDQAQRPSRTRLTAATTSGIASPVAVRRQAGGRELAMLFGRSSSSIRCCRPIFFAGSLPVRIQRRIVSGSLPSRRAVSATSIIV